MTIKPVMQFSTKTLNSTRVEGLQMIEKLAFSQKPTRPTIMLKKLSLNGETLAEVGEKRLSNGLMFETYNANGSKIKLIKNIFGELLAFKTNIQNYPFNPHKLVENMKDTIRYKFASFYHIEPYYKK